MAEVLVYDDAKVAFTVSEIEQSLRSMQNVKNIRKSPDVVAAVEGVREQDGGMAIIRLISNRNMISLQGDLESVAQSTFELNKLLKKKLRVIDEGYNFDFVIGDSLTADELRIAIAEFGE